MLYLRFVIRRLLIFFPLLVAASFIIFFALRFSGTDPVSVMLGERQATDEVIAALREQFQENKQMIPLLMHMFQCRTRNAQRSISTRSGNRIEIIPKSGTMSKLNWRSRSDENQPNPNW